MKTSFLFILLTFFGIVRAQNSDSCNINLFSKIYDFGSDEVPHSIYRLRDGNIGIVGVSNKKIIGGNDIFITKVRPDGRLIWNKYFGTTSDELGYPIGICDDKDYNIYIYASTNYSSFNTSFLCKLDSSGNVLFSEISTGNSVGDHNRKGLLLSNGKMLFVGTSSITNDQAAKIYPVEADGSKTWSYTYNSDGETEHFVDVQELNKKLYLMGGTSKGSGNYGSFIVKVRLDGSTVWQKYIDYANYDAGMHLQTTHQSTIITVHWVSNSGSSLYGGEDFGIFHTDTNGNKLWSKVIGKAGAEHATGLVRIGDFYYISGTSTSFDGGKSKLFIIKFDINGDIIWSKIYGASGEVIRQATFTDCLDTSNGGMVLLGYKTNTNDDIVMYKIDACGNSNCPSQDVVFNISSDNTSYTTSSLTDLGILNTQNINTVSKKSTGVYRADDKCPPECDIHAAFSYKFNCIYDSARYADSSYVLSGKPINKYKWVFHDNTEIQNEKKAAYKYPAAGNYKVSLIVYSETCSDTITKTIRITNKASAKISAVSASYCQEDSISLSLSGICGTAPYKTEWFPKAYVKQTDSLNVIVFPPSSMWIRYVLTDANNAVATDSVFINIDPACCKYKASVQSPKTQYCLNDTLKATNVIKTAGASYKWYVYANGILTDSFSSEDIPGIALNQAGIWRLRLRVYGTCKTAEAEMSVTVHALPIADAGNDLMLCDTATVKLGTPGPSNHSYLWSPSSGLLAADSSQTKAFINKSLTYYLKVKDLQTSCENNDSIHIELVSDSGWGLGDDTAICEGQVISLNAGSGRYQYLWDNNSTNPQREISAAGRYIVTRTSVCGSSSDTIQVKAKDCFCELFLPNAMSPDANAVNDYFPEQFLDTIIDIQIYNRWGEKLYDQQQTRIGWNGYYEGSPVQEDVYLYIITYYNCYGQRRNRAGTFTLLR